ncbi:hypothetical protein AB0L85_16625 [Streptomyces sp. NPDC052051]|uniref:DUF6893 family small protein n=1 Tax=Streptomyces sp. NPDC052051 TaxID=3154649 RepID=UPI0034369EA8
MRTRDMRTRDLTSRADFRGPRVREVRVVRRGTLSRNILGGLAAGAVAAVVAQVMPDILRYLRIRRM